jgi:hypothetical protein
MPRSLWWRRPPACRGTLWVGHSCRHLGPRPFSARQTESLRHNLQTRPILNSARSGGQRLVNTESTVLNSLAFGNYEADER